MKLCVNAVAQRGSAGEAAEWVWRFEPYILGYLKGSAGATGRRERGSLTAPRTNVLGSFRQRYPQTRKAVGDARRTVVAFAQSCGFGGQDLEDIEVAVGEALANAFEHGHCESDSFEVWAKRDAGALSVEVKDFGRGFDHGDPRSRERPAPESVRGFGTFIMRDLMDSVEYSEHGTRVRLTKRLSAPQSQADPALEA